jgi:hypothetical protein
MEAVMIKTLSEPGASAADQGVAIAPSRTLKIAVVVMGVILVVGFIAVFITIAYRVANPRVIAPGEAGHEKGFEHRVALPGGAEVSGLEFTGDRVLVTVTAADGAKSLIVLDATRGRTIGRFALEPE